MADIFTEGASFSTVINNSFKAEPLIGSNNNSCLIGAFYYNLDVAFDMVDIVG